MLGATQFLVPVTSAVRNVKGYLDPEPVWQLTYEHARTNQHDLLTMSPLSCLHRNRWTGDDDDDDDVSDRVLLFPVFLKPYALGIYPP